MKPITSPIEDRDESLESIKRGMEQAKRGEGRPMREFLESLAAEYGISLHHTRRSRNQDRPGGV